MIEGRIDELHQCLKLARAPWKFEVAVLPDFFIDRLVTFPREVKDFSKELSKVADRFGGNIQGIKQIELRGGNAANTAAALAALGVKVHLITVTSPLGEHLLKFYFDPLGVDLSHVKTNGETSFTTALELIHHGERVNIMLGDSGSMPNFGPESLTKEDFQLLSDVDYVCVFNWASTSRLGTELAETVFNHVKEKGKAKTYYDTGDPNPNKDNIPRLIRNVFCKKSIDVLSLNENEVYTYAKYFNSTIGKSKKTLKNHELAWKCGRLLAKKLPARIDVHTSKVAGSFFKHKEVVVPTFDVQALRSTGAGDAWNAGNILGDALGLPDSSRISLANAVAAYYVSSPTADHPKLSQLTTFCSKHKQV